MAAKQPLPRPVFATEGKGGRGAARQSLFNHVLHRLFSWFGGGRWSRPAMSTNCLIMAGGRTAVWDSTKVWEEDKSESTEKASLVFPHSIFV